MTAVLGVPLHLCWHGRITLAGTDGQKFALTDQPHHLLHLSSSLQYMHPVVPSWFLSLGDVSALLPLLQTVLPH